MTESVPGTTDDAVDQPPSRPGEHDLGRVPPGPPVDPAPEPDPVEVRGLERHRGVRLPRWVVVVGGLLALLGLVATPAAIVAGTQWADLYAADAERGAVRDAATTAALRLTTFEGENIEDWYAATLTTATGDYADQLREVFGQETRDQLRDIQAVSRGEIDNLFVQDVNGDEASAFALVTQTYANSSTGNPVEDHLRMDLTLRKVDGEWLASEVAVLGPSGVIAPTGTAPTPAPGGDE